MEIDWLEDFLAVVACGSFSRAAERRGSTQPAVSRRIKALESWVGASLLDRTSHRVELTAAGRGFHAAIEETLRRLRLARTEAREAEAAGAAQLRFAATHALSLVFFPHWLRMIEDELALGQVSLVADHMTSCEQMMLRGHAQFLLCHHHTAAATALDPARFIQLTLAKDALVPVSAPDGRGRPKFDARGAAESLPLLAYSDASGIGRILASVWAARPPAVGLKPSFTSHLALVLKALAEDGRGIVWTPRSLVERELKAGVLVEAGGPDLSIDIDVCLVRPRLRQSLAAERLWALLKETAKRP